MKISEKKFGYYKGHKVMEIFITNKKEETLSFLNLGARINRWILPNSMNSIVLGYSDLNTFERGKNYYYGASIVPVAGRIYKAKFIIDNEIFRLKANEGNNLLHSGDFGLDSVVWDYDIYNYTNEAKVVFKTNTERFWQSQTLIKNQRFPGNIEIEIVCTFDNESRWTIEYFAVSNEDTLFNPTNHVYFNLNGDFSRDITNHHLTMDASHVLYLDNDGIPSRKVPIELSPFNFKNGKNIHEVMNTAHDQLKRSNGIDHPFYLNNKKIQLYSQKVNRRLNIETDRLGVVIYTHGKVEENISVFGEEVKPLMGIAIETQMPPIMKKSLNFDNFYLRANEKYHSTTSYQIEY